MISKMKILLDFTQIPITRTGVGVYAENLVRELSAQLSENDVLVLLLQSDEAIIRDFARKYRNISVCLLPSKIFRHRVLLMLFEQLLMPLLLWRDKIDIVHSLHYTHPLFSPCPRVVTIHDLTFILFPELHTRGRRLIMPFFIRHAMKHAEALIFVSDATRRDAESLMPGGQGMHAVVPLGVELKDFIVMPTETPDVLAKLSIHNPFLLFLGTIEPRKNIERLINAFENIANDYPELHLVVAGKLGWNFAGILEKATSSKFKHRIHMLGFISDYEKKYLLSACSVLVYPSLYEGFGLPVLEGMAAGAPVVTSNVSSLPEVAGNAALQINPFSVENMTEAIEQILREPKEALRLNALGKQRAAEFDWKKTAIRTYNLYWKAMQSQHSLK